MAIVSVFLDASTDALVRRFSETRRPHPLSDEGMQLNLPTVEDSHPMVLTDDEPRSQGRRALIDAIELERQLLAGLREVSTVLDTSQLRPAQLRAWVRDLVGARSQRLALVFERSCVQARRAAGRRLCVRRSGAAQPALHPRASSPHRTGRRRAGVPAGANPKRWKCSRRSRPSSRAGCRPSSTTSAATSPSPSAAPVVSTRSVFFVETLAQRFSARASTLVRHRELDARD